MAKRHATEVLQADLGSNLEEPGNIGKAFFMPGLQFS